MNFQSQQNTEAPLHEVNGILAKLMARENIRIHFGNFQTASFHVQSRILRLPLWTTKSKDVYDLLIGHEVGHALFTPLNYQETLTQAFPGLSLGAIHDLWNIVEDIRIERMIQEYFPGLRSSFLRAYSELVADGTFFNFSGKDPNTLRFVDRLNVHAKVGHCVKINFSESEKAIYDRAHKAKSHDEVIEIVRDIYLLMKTSIDKSSGRIIKAEKKAKKIQGIIEKTFEDGRTVSDELKEKLEKSLNEEKMASERTSVIQSDVSQKAKKSCEAEKAEDEEIDLQEEDEELKELLQSTTLKSADEAKRLMCPQRFEHEFFIEPNAKTVRKLIIPYTEVMASRKKKYGYADAISSSYAGSRQKDVDVILKRTKLFVKDLRRQFEARKSAYQYSRQTVARTGVLNMNRIHSYKTSDDIFKSLTKLGNSKSHGLILLMDNSSSMNRSLPAVLEQMMCISLFCRQSGIPFDTYAFTTTDVGNYEWNETQQKRRDMQASLAYNDFDLCDLRLVQLFSSSMSKPEFDLAFREVTIQVCDLGGGSSACRSDIEASAGTPLLETITAAHTLINDFLKKHSIQKMNLMILSDGDGNHIKINTSGSPETYASHSAKWTGTLNGKRLVFSAHDDFEMLYTKFIHHLKKTTGVTITGFFIPMSKHSSHEKWKRSFTCSRRVVNGVDLKTAGEELLKDVKNDFNVFKRIMNKDGCVEQLGGFGMDAYFILPEVEDLEIEDEENFNESFDDNETLSAGKIARRFEKFMSVKRTSRQMIMKFSKIIS